MLPKPDGRSSANSADATIENATAISLPLDLGEVVATEVIARGGMGITLLGFVASDQQKVAVKIPLNADANLQERFRHEIKLLAGLEHEKIVRFVTAGEAAIPYDGGTHELPWLAMEFIPGQSLRAALTQGGPMPWRKVFRMLEDMLSALEYLHSASLCHRDIKPDNLIHDPRTDTWKLVDFGIAKATVENLFLTVTLAESHPGAWDYMSPEQLSGQSIDIRSDIYSLGKTAWESLIGEVPRVGTPYPSAFVGQDKVPSDVDLLIQKMVAHQPEARYQTPAEALLALRKGAGAIARQEERRKSAKKYVWLFKASAAAIILIAAVWFVGDRFGTQKAKEIVSSISRDHPTRATLVRRKLEGFRNTHWIWGRGYADKEIIQLEETANDELKRMDESHQEILAELADPAKDNTYKLGRCSNFLSLYEEAFPDASQIKELSQQREVSEARVLTNQAEQLARDGKAKEAIERCVELKTNLNCMIR